MASGDRIVPFPLWDDREHILPLRYRAMAGRKPFSTKHKARGLGISLIASYRPSSGNSRNGLTLA